jgi:cytochrome P450
LKEWGDCYGLIYSLKIGNATMVVLNDPSAVHQLMNKKGALFVDRPLEKQWELATNGDILPLMHAGSAWRAMRKIGTQAMSPKVLDDRLAEIQEAE